MCEVNSWKGSSILDLCNNKGLWSFSVTPINISKNHAVLYTLPAKLKEPPAPYKPSNPKHWDNNYVRMPFSDKNVIELSEGIVESRWKIIKSNLKTAINSSYELESVIRTYNPQIPPLTALHNFFEELEEYSEPFFDDLLPKIISLALKLPEIVPGSLPILKQQENRSVSLSQLQISSLLANAFLCTFPYFLDSPKLCPGLNFVKLFTATKRPKRRKSINEKIKCIISYFVAITRTPPVGVVTFERKYVSKNNIPRWDTLDRGVSKTKIHIDSKGTIEDAFGFLQVDFANKNIGGGVLGYGCVQEEIRFVICPELIVSRLFVEQLTDLEAVIITGIQRFSEYSGYAETFEWQGPYVDKTPHDEYGRRKTSLCVIDATKYAKTSQQFFPSAMLREINKAYVGFQFESKEKLNLAPVATGNWGCGAYNGSRHLKGILQLIACNSAERHLVYYTFGDEEFKNDFYSMYQFLIEHNLTVNQIWKFICQFTRLQNDGTKLYSYIKKAYFDSKKQPTIRQIFSNHKKINVADEISIFQDHLKSEASSSNSIPSNNFYSIDIPKNDDDDDDDIIPGTPPDNLDCTLKKKKLGNEHKSVIQKLPKTDIGSLIDNLEGGTNINHKEPIEDSLLEHIDKLRKQSKVEPMDVSDSEEVTTKRKISDYFQKAAQQS